MMVQYMYAKNNLNGLSKSFYDSGQIKAEGSFKEAKEDGEWKYFYENGKIKESGPFVNGIKTGIWTLYNDQGDGEKTQEFKDGILVKEKIITPKK
jgi:antitoxin component YwqK of YwqJK toxin-antitoxin module